jgi:hypothetical protein
MDHAPTVAPANFHHPLDAFSGPGCPQGWKLAQRTLVADPDLSLCGEHLLDLFGQCSFF